MCTVITLPAMVNPIPRWAAVEDIAVNVSPIPDTKPPIMTSLRCDNNPSNAVAIGPAKRVECKDVSGKMGIGQLQPHSPFFPKTKQNKMRFVIPLEVYTYVLMTAYLILLAALT